MFSTNVNCIIINDKELIYKDIDKYFCPLVIDKILFLDKNQNNDLVQHFVEKPGAKHVVINSVPAISLKTESGYIYYVNVNQEINDVEAIKIFNIMFEKSSAPIYITKTTEHFPHSISKLIKMLEYWNKYEDEFGYAYSDYEIDFGNGHVTIMHQELLQNINFGGLMIRPLDPEKFNTIEDFLNKISENFAVFHIPSALNKITIKDYKKQYAKKQ